MANERSSSGWPGPEPGRPESSEAVNRQLRRRYESLREDYDELLDRLAEVEGRLRRSEQPETDSPGRASFAAAISEAIGAPLFALRDDYLEAARELSAMADAVDQLGWRAFKRQRGSTEAAEAPATAGLSASSDERVGLDVHVDSSDLGMLLDFQEQVANLPNVARVSLSQVHEDRAVLTVELRRPN